MEPDPTRLLLVPDPLPGKYSTFSLHTSEDECLMAQKDHCMHANEASQPG